MNSSIEPTDTDPQSVAEARDAVIRSRERISTTLDQLEGRIVEKKHELRNKADVLRPVRAQVLQRPFTAVAIGIGVGALLGSIGGRDNDGDRTSRSSRGRGNAGSSGFLDDDDRRELREWRRARRERLRTRLAAADHDSDDGDDGDERGSRFGSLKHQLIGAVTSAIGAAVTARVRQMAMGHEVAGNGRGSNGRDEHTRDDVRSVH